MMMVAELLPGKMCKEEGEITSLIAISRRLNHEEYKQDAIKRKEACFVAHFSTAKQSTEG